MRRPCATLDWRFHTVCVAERTTGVPRASLGNVVNGPVSYLGKEEKVARNGGIAAQVANRRRIAVDEIGGR